MTLHQIPYFFDQTPRLLATRFVQQLIEGGYYFFRKPNDSYICAGYIQVIELELRTKAMEPFVPLADTLNFSIQCND